MVFQIVLLLPHVNNFRMENFCMKSSTIPVIESSTVAGNCELTVYQHCLYILRENLLASEIVLAIHAAEGLTETGYGCEVRDAFLPRFLKESSDRNQCLLARELVRAGDKDKVDVLILALERTEDALQVVAAESLFKLRHIVDEDIARRVHANASNAKLKLHISAILACQGDRKSLDRIKEDLFSEVVDARMIAAWILTRIGSHLDVSLLQKLRLSETDTMVCAYIDHALAALKDESGIRSLRMNLSSDCAVIRRMATETSRLIQSSVILQKLNNLLNDQDCDVQIRAAHALLIASTISRQSNCA